MRLNRINLRTLSWFVASIVVVGLVAACGAADEAADEPLFANAFAGEVDDDLFIGVLVADYPSEPQRKALVVYLCDGADVSTWLFGEAIGDSAVLETAGVRVELSLGEESVVGEVERTGGAPRSIAAALAASDAGLFRTEQTIDGLHYVGGWIILNDARQRGAITLDGEVVENPTLDPYTGEAETSLGTFGTNCFRDPRTGERICRYLN